MNYETYITWLAGEDDPECPKCGEYLDHEGCCPDEECEGPYDPEAHDDRI